MRIITKINTWKSPKGEFRIYVSFEGCKNQGCYYKSGNYYQPKGTLENMDTEELKAALEISSQFHGKNIWGCVYENQIKPVAANKKYNSDTENWMPNQMRKDAAKGFPVNPADYLNM